MGLLVAEHALIVFFAREIKHAPSVRLLLSEPRTPFHSTTPFIHSDRNSLSPVKEAPRTRRRKNEMAPRSRSNSRRKRAKTPSSSSSMAGGAHGDNLDPKNPAGSLSPSFQTPPAPAPTLILRRSLRLSVTSAGSGKTSPNPNPGATSGPGSTSRTNRSSLGKRKAIEESTLDKGKGKDKGKDTLTTDEVSGEPASVVISRLLNKGKDKMVVDKDSHGKGKDTLTTDEVFGQPASVVISRLLNKGKEKMVVYKDSDGKGKDTLTMDKVCREPASVDISRLLNKGKAEMVVDKDSDSTSLLGLGSDSDSDSDSDSETNVGEGYALGEEIGVAHHGMMPPAGPAPVLPVARLRREAQRNKAIELAPRFAFFKDNEAVDSGGETDDDEPVPDAGAHDWPGPFSTAMKIIEEREAVLRARQEGRSSKGSQATAVPISWTPCGDRRRDVGSFCKKPPSLKSLCIKVLADNAHEIESLEALPDMVKNRLVPILCHSRKMTAHHLSELARGSPVELKLSDCSWAMDKEFEDIFMHCDFSELRELQLDLCGRCLPDYILHSSLARGPSSLPSLTKLSLKGAYSLSNDGLTAIILSAPLLSSLNLCQCSLLTSEGITLLADNKGPALRELYLDNCQNVNAMSILPSLKKAECLEVLSMAGIPTVSDKFIRELIPVCGSTIKELNFAGCSKLTSSAMRVIGENCPQLSALDICNLTRLKDVALGHLANGCRDMNRLLLRRSSFSDEAIAAFVEASGTKLIELSLNNIDKVGHQTAIAISRRCGMALQKLDLSFCRRMSDQALGLMVDSCSSLKTLKLFGCTQVTDVFLKGHSNAAVQIVGLGDILGDIQNLDIL